MQLPLFAVLAHGDVVRAGHADLAGGVDAVHIRCLGTGGHDAVGGEQEHAVEGLELPGLAPPGVAVVAGETMFRDTDYIEQTKKLISSERTRIFDLLKKHPDFKVYEPDGNFMLARILREDISSQDLIDYLHKQGKQNAYFATDKKAAADLLLKTAKSGDRIVIMGARDNSLTDLCKQILERL